MKKRYLHFDADIINSYCTTVCTVPHCQCAMCALRKVHDATEQKIRHGKTTEEAIKAVERMAKLALNQVKRDYDVSYGLGE